MTQRQLSRERISIARHPISRHSNQTVHFTNAAAATVVPAFPFAGFLTHRWCSPSLPSLPLSPLPSSLSRVLSYPPPILPLVRACTISPLLTVYHTTALFAGGTNSTVANQRWTVWCVGTRTRLFDEELALSLRTQASVYKQAYSMHVQHKAHFDSPPSPTPPCVPCDNPLLWQGQWQWQWQ